jgi:chromosome segregation ATPase
MRKLALALTLGRWKELILSGRDKVAETKRKAPDLAALLDELELRHERTSALEVERLRLKAEHQRVTQEIRQMRTEGDEIAIRISNTLKSVFGIQSAALIQFGMRPKPRKYRRRSASRRQKTGSGSE